MRTGAAISVAVHLAAVTALLVLAGVSPFDPTAAEAISVELVTPDEAPPVPKEPDPTYDFPTLSDKDQQKPPAEAAAPKEQAQPAPSAAPSQSPAAKSKPDQRQAALQQKATEQQKLTEQQKPIEQSQPAEQQQPQAQPEVPQAQPDVPTAQPDITSKFGMSFAMPDASGDFDAKATASANVSVKDAAALREHLKTCSTLPRSVSLSDDVRVVLRVSFTRDGRLANEPTTIEVKGAEKAPPLWRSAMDALKKCQPFDMLPADRYNEWRMLDLSFTPKDFKGG